MVQPFPTEILERIIYYYFKRDELLHTPEDNFTLLTPTRGSTSLLLVSRAFRLLVLPALFYSVSITSTHHWLPLQGGSGLLAGDGEEAKTRRSWVRELRFDLDVVLPVALGPDGISLPPDRYQQARDESFFRFEEDRPSPALISVTHPSHFPNLDRIVLHSSSCSSSHPPWSPHLLRQLEHRHLEFYRKEINDPLAEFPEQRGRFEREATPVGSTRLKEVVLRALEMENSMEQYRFWQSLESKNIWVDLRGRTRDWELGSAGYWPQEEVRKYLVYPRKDNNNKNDDAVTHPSMRTLPPLLSRLTRTFGTFEEFESMASNIRFVAFPSDPVVRRLFWNEIVWEAGQQGLVYHMLDLEDDEELEAAMLEVVKGKNWAWVEEDGREVGFEEGLGVVEEVEEI